MRARLAVLIALLLVALPGAASSEPIRVALLPIVVHSSEPDSGYLSEGLASMLSARLEQAGDLRVVRVSSGVSQFDTEGVAEAARTVDAAYALFGAFTQFGEGASLDVRCIAVDDASASPREVFIQSGSLGEIIPKLDHLAGKVARYVDGAAAAAAPAVAVEQNGSDGDNGDGGPSYEDLAQRVDALERAVYLGEAGAPVDPVEAGGEPLAITGAEEPLEITGAPTQAAADADTTVR